MEGGLWGTKPAKMLNQLDFLLDLQEEGLAAHWEGKLGKPWRVFKQEGAV